MQVLHMPLAANVAAAPAAPATGGNRHSLERNVVMREYSVGMTVSHVRGPASDKGCRICDE